MAAATPKPTLLDLNKDVLLIIRDYLDIYSLRSLVVVCRQLRDILYDPVFWKDTVVELYLLDSQAHLQSFRRREIKTMTLTEETGPVNEVIECSVVFDRVETMVCTHHPLVDIVPSDYLRENFANLRCLVLVLPLPKPEAMADPGQCLETFLGALGSLTELHIDVQALCLFAAGGFTLMELVARCLPKLKDLDITRHDDDNPDFEFLPLDFESCGGFNIERLSGIQIPARNTTELEELTKRLPSLKHLKLGYGLCMPFSDDGLNEDAPWKTIQSFAVACNDFGRWGDFAPFFSFLPNLRALDLRCHTQQCIHGSITTDSLLFIAKSCPKIAVLKLPRRTPFLNETGILNCVGMLPDLEVLVFPPGKGGRMDMWSNEFIDQISTKLTKLKSLLGVDSDRVDLIPGLRYKSDVTYANDILTRQGPRKLSVEQTNLEPANKMSRVSLQWRHLTAHTDAWYDAQGTAFFYPPTSMPNIKFTQRQKSSWEDEYFVLGNYPYGASDDSDDDWADNSSDDY